MSADDVRAEIANIEEDLQPYVRAFWARARQFLTAFVPAFIVALWAARSHLTLALVLSIAGGIGGLVLHELWPSVPWSAVGTALRRARIRNPLASSMPPRSGT
jgi:hypothetical protein